MHTKLIGITRSSWFVWSVFITLMSLVGIWGNLNTKPGPVVPKKAFLNEQHPTNIGTALADSLGWNEILGVVIRFQTDKGNKRPFDLKDIPTLIEFHERFENFVYDSKNSNLFDGVVQSVANYDRLTYLGGLGSVPYIRDDMGQADLLEFQRNALVNPGLNTRFVGKDFSFATYLLFINGSYDDYAVGHEFSENILQGGVPISLLQTGLNPVEIPDAKLYAVGWSIARFWITRMLYIDNLKLVCLGFLVLMIIFWFDTRSIRHTLLFLGGDYIPVFLLVRGSIGFLDATGIFPMKERVFVTLPFALILVLVVSIASHSWNSFRRSLRNGEDPVLGIRKSVGSVLFLAMFVAFVSFALGALTTNLQTMAEIGILFSLSLLYTWFISMEVIPLVLRFRYFCLYEDIQLDEGLIEKVFNRVSDFAVRKNFKTSPSTVLGFMVIMIMVSGALVGSRIFILGGGSERYLEGTHFEESMDLMNSLGMPGFVGLNFDFTCLSSTYGENSHRNPNCISDIQKIADVAMRDTLLREVEGLPVGQMAYLSDSLLYKKAPETELDVERIFESLESSGTYFDIEPQMLHENGYRMIFTTTYSEGSTLGKIRDSILEEANSIVGIKATAFDSDATWADMDVATVRGSIWNVIQDVALLFFLVILYIRFFASTKIRKGFYAWRVALIVIMPFVFTTCVMIIVMSIFQIPLDTSTGSINQMVVAAAADFLFFLMFAYLTLVGEKNGHALSLLNSFRETGSAVTGDAVFNSIAFTLLLTSSFEPIRMLGLLLIVAVASAWFSTMFLLLPAMRWAIKHT